jgi:iron(III) transport system ATP-binding protein
VRDSVATTGLGRLAVGHWSGPPGGGPAQVLVRPEQIVLARADAGGVEATVKSYEYFGHDAVVRVRPARAGLPDLVVRVTGGRPVQPGRRVGVWVDGPVVAWPLAPDHDPHAHARHDQRSTALEVGTENSRTTPP